MTSYASYAHYARRSSIFWTFPDLSPFFMIDPIWLTNLRSVTWAEHVWTNPIPFGTSPISPVNMCMTWGIHHFWTNQKYGYMHNYTQRYKLLINCVSTHIYIYMYMYKQVGLCWHAAGDRYVSCAILLVIPSYRQWCSCWCPEDPAWSMDHCHRKCGKNKLHSSMIPIAAGFFSSLGSMSCDYPLVN